MKDTLSDEEINHPVNENLLKEAESIRSERKTIKERMEKLDQSREGVSPAVHQRVKSDYESKLRQTMERLIALKKDLQNEERILVEKRSAVQAAIKSHKESIEESQLRHALGEITAGQHQEVVQRDSAELKRLDNALKELSLSIERHSKIFEGEEVMPKEKLPEPVKKTPLPEISLIKKMDVTEKAKKEHTGESTDRIVPPLTPVQPEKKIGEILVLENGKVTQMVPLDKTISIGRSPANEIILKEPKVSRKHAEIQYVAGKYVIVDLESSNGTYVGGKKVTEYTLQLNDEITIGNTKMVFKI